MAEAYAQAELIHGGASAYECAAIANIRRIEGRGRNAYTPINGNGDHLTAMEDAGESLRSLLESECAAAAQTLASTGTREPDAESNEDTDKHAEA